VLSVLSLPKDRDDEMKFSESLPFSISEQSVKALWTQKSQFRNL
jgi:hypothetical protein